MSETPAQAGQNGLRPTNPLSVVDRRSGVDRRDLADDRSASLERRRGPGRRRTDFLRAAEEGEMTSEQFLFIQAIEAFKKANGKTFPTWTDVLEVIRRLGYRKTMASEVEFGADCQDWTESPTAPSQLDTITYGDVEDDRAA